MDECLLTTREYASEHGVSQRTVQRWIHEGLIFAVRIGRGLKIACDEIDPRELGSFPVPPDEPTDNPDLPDVPEEPGDDGIIGGDDDPCESLPCGCDTPDEIDVVPFDRYPQSERRPPKSTYEEAVSYMSEIQCGDVFIIRRAEDCFYQVIVQCSK